MRKRLLSIFLTLCLTLTLCPMIALADDSAPTSGTCGADGDNLTWTFENGTLTISGTGAMKNYTGSEDAPWHDYQWNDENIDENIRTVKIEEGVTTIGDYAFANCIYLTNVTVPSSVVSIGREAFYYCGFEAESLNINLPKNGLISIGVQAFYENNLKTIELPDTLRSIGNGAFYWSDLQEVTLPPSITTIGAMAFATTEIPSIEIPASVTSIGVGAFALCYNLTKIEVSEDNTSYASIGGILFNKDKTELLQYPMGKTETSYTIPDSVATIGQDAFTRCDSLSSIYIPNSVTSIEEGAFFALIEDLKDVYYTGTKAQWESIQIGDDNEDLTSATIHYNGSDEPSQPTVYTVTFDANGGNVSTSSAQTGTDGKLSSLPTATRSGYTFDDWYTSQTGGEKVTEATVFNKDTTVYAHWTAIQKPDKTYNITFDANGGSVATSSAQTSTDGKLSSLPTPSRNGYTFDDWYTSQTGGNRISTATVFDKDTTVYAHWTVVRTDNPSTPDTSSGSSSSGTSGTSSPSLRPLPERNHGTTTPANPSTTQPEQPEPSGQTPTPQNPTSLSSFTDIPTNHWAADAITWANTNGYINGTSATTFNPDGKITRQQLWMILARLNNQNPANMSEARSWAISNQISDGSNAAQNMSRQQLVTFLYRYCNLKNYAISGSTALSSYPDQNTVSDYAKDALSWAVGNRIMTGTNQGTLNPTGTATRAQFTVILQRFYNNVVDKK